jgi:prepilin peptidase CpaA
MLQAIKHFLKDEEGASAVEYGLILGLIAVALIAVMLALGGGLGDLFGRAEEAVTAALLAWLVVVAVVDLKSRRIPNLLILPIFVMGSLALAVQQTTLLTGLPWTSGLAGSGIAAAPWLTGYVLGKGGAGDVKFAATLGLLVGAEVALVGTLLAMALFGALSLAWMRFGARGLRLPLGPLIALGFAVGYGQWRFGGVL